MSLLARICILLSLIGVLQRGFCQSPVELFAGSKQSTFDVQLIRDRFVAIDSLRSLGFFSRNRAELPYKSTQTDFFLFIEALSWQDATLKGFAPVYVFQAIPGTAVSKLGLQWVWGNKTWFAFNWLVLETRKAPLAEHFFQLRYQKALSSKWSSAIQYEHVYNRSVQSHATWFYIQRWRVSAVYRNIMMGPGLDFTSNPSGSGINPGFHFRVWF